jgi:predicted DNA-binding antitoxin AbrB/MazE fold protein
MVLTVEAVYENGVLKPAQPLPLKEHEKIRITLQQGDSPLLRAYGIMGWSGDAETIERVALDPEFLPEESPWSSPTWRPEIRFLSMRTR